MIPTAYNAWKSSEKLRKWFEVAFDTTVTPPKHSGYICKSCWELFPASVELMELKAHAGKHESEGDNPYSLPRPSPITGEEVLRLHADILQNFEVVDPEVGTWKFRCLSCLRNLPHRTPYKDLMEHARYCGLRPRRENAIN